MYDIIHEFKVSLIRWQTPLKMHLAESCQNRAWQRAAKVTLGSIHLSKVQSRRLWSGVLLDKDWPVLVVQRIQTCNVLCCQPNRQGGGWWDNLLARCRMQGCPSQSWTGSLQEITTLLVSLRAGRSIPAQKLYNHRCWTFSLHAGRSIPANKLYNHSCWTSSHVISQLVLQLESETGK